MAKRGFDSTDMLQFMNYQWPVCGTKTYTGAAATESVVLATIEATDVVLTQLVSSGSVSTTILQAVVQAGSGFYVTFNERPWTAAFSYAVFKKNS